MVAFTEVTRTGPGTKTACPQVSVPVWLTPRLAWSVSTAAAGATHRAGGHQRCCRLHRGSRLAGHLEPPCPFSGFSDAQACKAPWYCGEFVSMPDRSPKLTASPLKVGSG